MNATSDLSPEQWAEMFQTNPAFAEQIAWAARWTERHPDVIPKE